MTVREAALHLLSEYESNGKYVNLSLTSHVADAFSPKERAFLTALLYTSVERKLTYDYYICALSGRGIDSISPRVRDILRLGLCQIISLDSIPDFAAVNETVKLAKNAGERSFINGVLRAAVRKKETDSLPLPDKAKNYLRYLSVRESFPLATVKLLASEYGVEATEVMLDAFNNERHTDIAVNTLKISRDAYLALLKANGYEASVSELSSISLRIPSSVDPRMLPGFDEGLFFVQDSACTASVEVLGARQGDMIADACSAPGGKSFAAAILTHDAARIHSFDIHESKLSLIEGGAARLALSSIKASVRDATEPAPELIGSLDRVICDVPCSGLGVLGKKPDLRYKSLDELGELPELQYSILSASSRYLKAGGRLIYSTCTLAPQENGCVVERFLAEHSDFSACDFQVSGICSQNGMLTLLPYIHRTDGFFIALLERSGNNEK